MKNKILLLLFILIGMNKISYTQNLVPNPSFEQYDTCPYNANQVPFATGWKNYCLTPDYFNACSSNPDLSVPLNILGYQPAATGNAYCGFFAYWSPYATPPNVYNAREHIGRQLSSPLAPNTKYYVSIKVSVAYHLGIIGCTCSCASSHIGVKFSTISYQIYANDSFTSPAVNNVAQIYTMAMITDTANWTTISGSFVADSTYNYIMIGNFFDDITTDTLILDTAFAACFSYYYLDDVCVSTDSLTCEITGIEESDFQNALQIYPNPFINSTTVIVKNRSDNLKDIALYDLLGRKQNIIPSTIFGNNNITIKIDRGNLSQGIYLLKIQFSNKTFTQKLLITN